MLKKLYPYEYVKNVHVIDYSKLYQMGYKAIIFDIDNTLVHHGVNSNPMVDQLIKDIQRTGLKVFLLSNNSAERIEEFSENMDVSYISIADKPKTGNYLKAVDQLDVAKEEVIMIGDQIFTDILGANRSGLKNILVEYMRYNNTDKIGIRRTIEKMILRLYKMSKANQNRLGDILRKEAN